MSANPALDGLSKTPQDDVQSEAFAAGQIALLRHTFALVEPHSDIAALVFYRNLFRLDPELQSLFHSSIELQGRKLMEALQFTVGSLENPTELVPVLQAMGRRHVTYGVQNEHYVTVKLAMLQTLNETLGDEFTPAAEESWSIALDFVCETMIRSATVIQELLRSGPSNGPGSEGITH